MKGRRIQIAGEEFIEVDASDLSLSGLVRRGEKTKYLMPYHPPDDGLNFPANSELENCYLWVGSGLTHYKVERKKEIYDPRGMSDEGFSAKQCEIFYEIDWHGECFTVLNAHGWLDHTGNLSKEIIDKIIDIYGQKEIQNAQKLYRENWTAYIGELAAIKFAIPLSRLWYAANMLSLYYAHHDDLRLGYLWAEYRIKMRHEIDSARGKKSVASARSGAEERTRRFQSKRAEIISQMKNYIDSGKTIANAAALAFKAGIGTSAEANRKLWTRQREK